MSLKVDADKAFYVQTFLRDSSSEAQEIAAFHVAADALAKARDEGRTPVMIEVTVRVAPQQ